MGLGVLCWSKVLDSGLPPRLLRPYSAGDKNPRLMMKATLDSQEHSKKLTLTKRRDKKEEEKNKSRNKKKRKEQSSQ